MRHLTVGSCERRSITARSPPWLDFRGWTLRTRGSSARVRNLATPLNMLARRHARHNVEHVPGRRGSQPDPAGDKRGPLEQPRSLPCVRGVGTRYLGARPLYPAHPLGCGGSLAPGHAAPQRGATARRRSLRGSTPSFGAVLRDHCRRPFSNRVRMHRSRSTAVVAVLAHRLPPSW